MHRIYSRLILLSVIAALSPACLPGGGGTPFPAELLFIADKDTLGLKELYAGTLDGTSFRKLSDPTLTPGSVGSAVLSPDHQWIAFVATSTLYVVSVDGGVPVAPTPGLGITGIPLWAPDSSRVAYLDLSRVLHTCRADGGGDAVLYSAKPVDRAFWAPDSSRIAYQLVAGGIDTALPDGTGHLMIVGTLAYGVLSPGWSSDSSVISYEAALDDYSGYEVYVLPPTGGASVRLSPVVSANSDSVLQSWSPDGARLAYVWFTSTPGTNGLYTATPAGSIAGPISTTFGGKSAWSPDSSWIAWTSVKTGGALELRTAAPDGTVPVTVTGSAGTVSQFRWAPDAGKIAYSADALTPGRVELFTTGSRAAGAVRVSAPQAGDDTLGSVISWAPGSSRVAYRIDSVTRSAKELHSAASAGGDVLLTPRLMEGANSTAFEWSADGSKVLYLADEDTSGIAELYLTPSNSRVPVKVSGPLAAGGSVSWFQLR